VAGRTAPVLALGRDLDDEQGLVARRYDLQPGSTLLFRPDQHLAMRSRNFDPAALDTAARRALGRLQERVAA
jgi:3-(3-hydroxy-phenyl)propionate hydroxylase